MHMWKMSTGRAVLNQAPKAMETRGWRMQPCSAPTHDADAAAAAAAGGGGAFGALCCSGITHIHTHIACVGVRVVVVPLPPSSPSSSPSSLCRNTKTLLAHVRASHTRASVVSSSRSSSSHIIHGTNTFTYTDSHSCVCVYDTHAAAPPHTMTSSHVLNCIFSHTPAAVTVLRCVFGCYCRYRYGLLYRRPPRPERGRRLMQRDFCHSAWYSAVVALYYSV